MHTINKLISFLHQKIINRMIKRIVDHYEIPNNTLNTKLMFLKGLSQNTLNNMDHIFNHSIIADKIENLRYNSGYLHKFISNPDSKDCQTLSQSPKSNS